MTNIQRSRTSPEHSSSLKGFALLAMVAFGVSAPAQSQISLGLDTGLLPNAVCVGSTNGTTVFVSASDDCATATGGVAAPYLQIGPDSSYALFDASNGASTFTGPVTVQNDADFNGTTSFTDVVSFTGPNATFATVTTFTFGSTFQAATTFNGTTDFNAAMTTNDITNSGTINSTNVNVTGSLTAAPGTTVNFGGVNRVQGVAAGINPLDAVNLSQLNAATSGITTSVTALQNTVATQGTAITAIQAIDSAQSSQIATLQATQDTLFDLRARDRRDMKQGVAAAMSMANAPMPSGPGKVTYAVNGAAFRGEYAVGGSLQYRLNTAAPMAINVGASFAGHKNNGVRVGVAGEF